MSPSPQESVISGLDWTGLDWTDLFLQIGFMTLKHVTITCLVVCCYFEEALQPCIPNPQSAGREEWGGRGCRLEHTIVIPIALKFLLTLLRKPILLFIPCTLPNASGQSSILRDLYY